MLELVPPRPTTTYYYILLHTYILYPLLYLVLLSKNFVALKTNKIESNFNGPILTAGDSHTCPSHIVIKVIIGIVKLAIPIELVIAIVIVPVR